MANVKISELTAATSVATTDEFEINAGGTSKKATGQKVADLAASSTNTLTNKTFDTAGTGNSFKINGTAVSAVSGTGSAVLATSPTLTSPTIASTTWANIPAAGTAGKIVFVSNAGTKGSFWFDDGTRWKPMNSETLLASVDTVFGNVGGTETIVFQYQIPAGMWQVGDIIRIIGTMEKSGATDGGGLYLRIGTAGTTSDTQLKANTGYMAAADRASSIFIDVRLYSATIAELCTAFVQSGLSTGSTLNPASVAISSATTNALYINLSMRRPSGTTDTLSLRHGQMFLISKAN